MARVRTASVIKTSSRNFARRSTTSDGHMRSLRPRSGPYTRRTVPPVQASRVPEGLTQLIATVLAAAMVTAAVVVLVWVKMMQVQAGYAIHQHQQQLVELKRQRSQLEVEVSSLRRPDRLARIGAQHFALYPPAPGQVVKLSALSTVTAASGAKEKQP